LSGIDSKLVRKRQLTAEHADRIDQALSTLEPLAERLAFVRPPYDLKNVAATADHFGEVGLIVLDYLQRIKPPGEHNDKRGSVDSLMDFIRQFADSGVAMLAVSSVSRTKDGHGRSSYSGEGLSLASFRESAEIEFGADDAFILHPEDDDAESDIVRLKHLKSRHGECRDIVLRFERSVQRFATIEGDAKQAEGKPNLTAALAKLYGQTEPAGGDDDE
jgi:replicative DNA helicase